MTNLNPNRPPLQRLNLFVEKEREEQVSPRHARLVDTNDEVTQQAEFLEAMGEQLGHDPVNHPAHYSSHPSGVECIQVTEWFNFNVGNAIKFLWRSNEKGERMQDLRKAAWYINREIGRLEAL
jgi:hypothetical protein